MAISVYEVSITESPLALPARENNPASGAIVDFWGAVRGLEEGREIVGIQYEAHAPMAEHQMGKLAQDAVSKFGLTQLIIRHRIGFVPTAEPSVAVRVESPHRSAAFDASQWIMNELKRTVPIWKHPVFKDSSTSEKAGNETSQQRPDSLTTRV